METIKLQIDGKAVDAEVGETIITAAKRAGIDIPSLCHHEKLAPYGACRLCTVEILKNGRTKLVASCAYVVEDGLVVTTDSDRLRKIRRMILELVMPLSPTGPVKSLARTYDLKESRFEGKDVGCNLCGLCVRYCAEVKGAHAITFTGRGIDREVTFVPEVACQVCDDCRECFALCPGGKLPGITDFAWFETPAFEC